MAVAVERRTLPRRLVLRRQLLNPVRFAQLFFFVALLVTWQPVGEHVGTFFLAPPTKVVSAFGELVSGGELQHAVGDSLV